MSIDYFKDWDKFVESVSLMFDEEIAQIEAGRVRWADAIIKRCEDVDGITEIISGTGMGWDRATPIAHAVSRWLKEET